MITKLIVLFLGLQASKCTSGGSNTCTDLDVTIVQKITNQGYHRDLNWVLEAPKWPVCNIVLRFETGRGLFVSPDQVNDLKRLGKLDAYIDGTVDVEAIAHEATGHTAYIFLNSSQKDIHVKLPIHLRYQRSLMGGHGKVILKKPDLLVQCLEMCKRGRKVMVPKSSDEPHQLVPYRNITYQAKFEEMELLVPVGNLDDYAWVAIITCILGCAGCIYLLSLSRQT